MDAREKFELRRKKILDNAEARLLRIRGRIDKLNHHPTEKPYCSDHSGFDQSGIVGPCNLKTTHLGNIDNEKIDRVDEEPAKKVPVYAANGDLASTARPPKLAPNPQTQVTENGSILGSSSKPDDSSTKSERGEYWQDWAAFVVLALLVRTAIALNYSWVIADNILIPFLVMAIPRLLYIGGGGTSANSEGGISQATHQGFVLLYVVLVMVKLRPNVASVVVSIFAIFHRLFRFLAVYLFAFVMAHIAVECSMHA